ncbi:MAG: chemotaxis protein CheW, partial [Cyanobacteria bacterium J06626_18]
NPIPKKNLFGLSSQLRSNYMDTSTLIPLPNRAEKATGDAYLQFQLGPQSPAVFAMQHIQEVMTLPLSRLTPMPNMPPCLLGLMNHRSHVLWVVDLAYLLELNHIDESTRQYNVIVIRVGKIRLGLAVPQINGIVWFEQDKLQSPVGHTSNGLVPYLQGCIWQENTMLLVLDAATISHASLLRNPDAFVQV